ncbi:hypothetical protein NPX13_g718 [Xylaria arbuscula]|uniref:Uncharacterized protein n=1 Tax=Xylaria arbuscula TaxID=114810 RepID=A0A9W8NNW0_9PEZI|nr:hypothetical protein NPX13_g718 [Xylaria arbuscula]
MAQHRFWSPQVRAFTGADRLATMVTMGGVPRLAWALDTGPSMESLVSGSQWAVAPGDSHQGVYKDLLRLLVAGASIFFSTLLGACLKESEVRLLGMHINLGFSYAIKSTIWEHV